jgi:ribonuclease Z
MAELARVVKVRNRDMKVAIAFDYMRVKIGAIIQLEKFNEALSELLVKEKDEDAIAVESVDGEGGKINKNGKKTSGDEAGGKKQKKSKRNN